MDYGKYGLKAYGALPNKKQMEWFRRGRSIFFHFGMNTFTDKEWGDGTESPEMFNPTDCDVDSWVKSIFEAGFELAILTAKHHDGFCLWQTKYTEHSIKNSPYKNGKGDIVREFTDACKKYGVKAGIYLSPWDRHEKTWGTPEYNDFYVGQLTELLTNYGEIWECWWDGAGSTEAVYDWERWACTVHALAPNAVIFGSLGATPWVDVRWVGNEKGIAGEPCYATIDASSLVYEYTTELNSGKAGGERFIPAEADVSIRPGWFYHKEEEPHSLERLFNTYLRTVGNNSTFNLNIPPMPNGKFDPRDLERLKELGELIRTEFKTNLAEGISFETLSGYGETQPEYVLKLNKKETIKYIEIAERISEGQRVESFVVFFKNKDNLWDEAEKNMILKEYGIPVYGMTLYENRFYSEKLEYWILWNSEISGFDKIIIPKSKWLLFHTPTMKAIDIQENIDKVFDMFLPSSKFNIREIPELEYYHDGVTDILIPIE